MLLPLPVLTKYDCLVLSYPSRGLSSTLQLCGFLLCALFSLVGSVGNSARFFISYTPVFYVVNYSPSPITVIINQHKTGTGFIWCAAMGIWGAKFSDSHLDNFHRNVGNPRYRLRGFVDHPLFVRENEQIHENMTHQVVVGNRRLKNLKKDLGEHEGKNTGLSKTCQ